MLLRLLLALQPAALAAEDAPSLSPSAVLEISGGPEFSARTREALDLLEKSGRLAEVRRYVGVIEESRCSGMDVYASRPTFRVGRATWRSGGLWYAGSIAHDSRHSRLYREAKTALGGEEPPAEAWTGTEAERLCLAFQLEVLEALGAGEDALNYIRGLMKDPRYQRIGEGLADPCDARDWKVH